jgi:hypothetical protein
MCYYRRVKDIYEGCGHELQREEEVCYEGEQTASLPDAVSPRLTAIVSIASSARIIIKRSTIVKVHALNSRKDYFQRHELR